ncbi:MAG TPA: thioredoxin domain-containing protein [Longimicrobium sp.]|nr:thioredoxin domain-containing protein [Longimicrobium sp.]
MNLPTFARARLALALVLTLAASVSACGAQEPAAERSTANRTSASALPGDSILARADRGRMKGQQTAPVTILEVSDFQCPYCRQWTEQTYAKIDSAYVRTGKARIIFINSPLSNHHEAFPAAKAAMCAAVQGKFWQMHDRIFATQQEWAGKPDAAQRFARFAVDIQLNPSEYRDCYENDRVTPVIINDVSGVAGAGIRGTPTFILNGQQALNGAVSFEEMSRAIDAIIAGGGAAQPQAPPTPPGL